MHKVVCLVLIGSFGALPFYGLTGIVEFVFLSTFLIKYLGESFINVSFSVVFQTANVPN